jgi:hypothetical protein
MSSITFRFIRTNTSSASDDEVCTVTRTAGGEFDLRFKYKDNNDSTLVNSLTAHSDVVQRWVRRAIEMIEVDADPFTSFQIDFPLLPSILFSVKDIGLHYHAILDAVEFSLDNWPTTRSKTPARTANLDNLEFISSSRNQFMNRPPMNLASRPQADSGSVSSNSSMPSLHPMQTRSQARHYFVD